MAILRAEHHPVVAAVDADLPALIVDYANFGTANFLVDPSRVTIRHTPVEAPGNRH